MLGAPASGAPADPSGMNAGLGPRVAQIWRGATLILGRICRFLIYPPPYRELLAKDASLIVTGAIIVCNSGTIWLDPVTLAGLTTP